MAIRPTSPAIRHTGLYWWIDRWRKSTAFIDMTLEQQGAYRNLLDEASLRGGAIPDNEDILAKACGDPRRWRALRDVILARFTLTTDGWRNDTLDNVLRETERRASKQRNYRHRNGPDGEHKGERKGEREGERIGNARR
jgi:uncharacterized protein YdaU (DUF1376 family)